MKKTKRIPNFLYRKIKKPEYIVSFPKSGRTWIRFFLAYYNHKIYSTNEIDLYTDSIPNTFNINTVIKYPRVEFEHIGPYPKKSTIRNKPVLDNFVKKHKQDCISLLVRDPRDVVVSYYHHTRRWNTVKEIQDLSIDDFIRHPHFGISRVIDYMDTWYSYKNECEKFRVFRYEDFVSSPREEFVKLLNYLDIKIDNEVIAEAISYSSFDNMKKIESTNSFNNSMLQPAERTEPNSFKVRKGKVGGYTSELSMDSVEYCNNLVKELHPDFGYF